MHWATKVCLRLRSDNGDQSASSPSDNDERSAQWDMCDARADNGVLQILAEISVQTFCSALGHLELICEGNLTYY